MSCWNLTSFYQTSLKLLLTIAFNELLLWGTQNLCNSFFKVSSVCRNLLPFKYVVMEHSGNSCLNCLVKHKLLRCYDQQREWTFGQWYSYLITGHEVYRLLYGKINFINAVSLRVWFHWCQREIRARLKIKIHLSTSENKIGGPLIQRS